MWKMKKVLPVIVLTLAIVFVWGTMAQADDYSSHWSAQFIRDASSRGWMTGDGNGNFRPEASITRGEFTVMLWRAMGQPRAAYACPFNDVAASAFYFEAVKALYEAKVVNGLDSVTFGPNNTLTREMGCSMLARAYKLSPSDPNAYMRFADAGQVSDWARLDISSLVEKNYISGVGENRIAPKQYLKRGEMAKLLITVVDGVRNAQSISTASQQAAITAITNYFSGPTITVDITVLGSNEVWVVVTATDTETRDVTYVGRRTSTKDATYKSKDGFTDITKKLEFSLEKNGWYAIYAENSSGYGSFKLFEITTIREDSPIVILSQELNPASGLVEVAIVAEKVSGGADIDFIGYRTAKEGSVYNSKTGFDDKNITNKMFTVDPVKDYGWYAVCAEDKDGKFGYRLIEIEKANTNCIVTFDAMGGSPTPAKQTVDFNTKIVKPNDPLRNGYILEGWYNNDDKWNFDDKVTKDMTLKAKWLDSNTKYTVTVGVNPAEGGTVTGGDAYSYGAEVVLTATPATGYDFAGWYENSNKLSETTPIYRFTVNNSRSLEARFSLKTYTISVEADPEEGGTVTVSGNGSFTYGAEVTVEAMANDGYVFDAWYEGANKVSDEEEFVFDAGATITLIAKFVLE
ncbi:MAG: S-layer homology domain-containing protein [Firmicutes bacterium]|nr:S-layer homology domain-containing protein [Bacillota bacterium]